MRFQLDDEIVIDAPVGAVWDVYADVERWPDWTKSVTEVRYVDGDTLAAGARVRIRQPKLRTTVWTVATVYVGRAWTWESRVPGMHTTAVHTLEPLGSTR